MTDFDGASIGGRIAKYRKINGWTMQELAERTGGEVKQAVIANIESGRREDVTVRQLMALAGALEVPPIALVLDIEHPGADVPDLPLRVVKEGTETQASRPMRVWEVMRWFAAEEREAATEPSAARELVNRQASCIRRYLVAFVEYDRAARALKTALESKAADPAAWTAEDEEWLEGYRDYRKPHALHVYWDAYKEALSAGVEIRVEPPEPEPEDEPSFWDELGGWADDVGSDRIG